MIAKLSANVGHATDAIGSHYSRFINDLKTHGFEGDIAADYANRTVLSTDNSIYQRLPQAVLYPKNAKDLELIAHHAALDENRQIVLTPRGGGTGTNAQSLTDGLVIDVSKYMNAILDIDVGKRQARVQAGVVKDQLNEALKPHGLFFAPELSTSNRATIGGMISTDASGQGSCEYGKTRDHVLELDVILLGGDTLVSRPVNEDELNKLCARNDKIGEIYKTAKNIVETKSELIRNTFPPLNRCLTGYDLAHLRNQQNQLDINSLLCGSEGSLGFLNEAVLNLLPIPKHSFLVNVRYSSFMDALRDAKTLMASEARPTSIETIDDNVLMLAMDDFIWDSVAEFFPDEGNAVRGINLIEFNGDDLDLLSKRVESFCQHLTTDKSLKRFGYTIAKNSDAISKVYAMRKRAVGLLGNVQGEKRPIPFVEDTAVPPENLADFIAEFRAILDARALSYGMFGHVDAGVLHVRPAIDMKDPKQERLIREISDEVAALTHKYGGLLWGEHGKGVRSEYAPSFFGELYPSLQQIKAVFDAYNQLNPGKIATPSTVSTQSDSGLLTIDGVPTRGQYDRQIKQKTWFAYNAAVYCNGNGACYNYDPNDAMCPSWKATRERVQSPKGRASLIREWLRLQDKSEIDVVAISAKQQKAGVTQFIRALPMRTYNTLRVKDNNDFSHQVYDAMAGCLACKSCSGQCPVKVSIPDVRSQFLEVYHSRYLRPARDYLIGTLEFALPTLSRVRPLYNGLLSTQPINYLLRKVIGMVDSPLLSKDLLKKQLTTYGITEANPASLSLLSPVERERSVILVQDAFTSYFEAQLIMDTAELLTKLNIRVFIAPFRPNGKPLNVLGFLGAFKRTAKKQASHLQALAKFDIPLVGVDPAMTLTYRQEYVKALGKEAAPDVKLLQEWLITKSSHFPSLKQNNTTQLEYKLLSHCTEITNETSSASKWEEVFNSFDLDLQLIKTGCCGMSGTYGHESRNQDTSNKIYALSWKKVIDNQKKADCLLATGYSCRSQVKRFSEQTLLHPVQALLKLLNETKRHK